MTTQMKANPIAVLISDVHFNLQTLDLALKASELALGLAEQLKVSLIFCGDTHDSKANMRSEVVSAMINFFGGERSVDIIMLVGNHDKQHEKSKENALEFLRPYITVVSKSRTLVLDNQDVSLIPYQNDPEEFLRILSEIPRGNTIVCHQGLTGAKMGHYMQDPSAIHIKDLEGRRVISGHYHTRQTTELGEGGLHDFVGNPFTLNFGEANDLSKGFAILYDDNSLEHVDTNLRKHIILETNDIKCLRKQNDQDLVWVKVRGPKSTLSQIKRADISKILKTDNFKLDLIPYPEVDKIIRNKNEDAVEILDSLIDVLKESDEYKDYIKNLWRGIVDA